MKSFKSFLGKDIVKDCFKFFKTVKLNKYAFLMLLFKVVPLNDSYKKDYFKLMQLASNNIVNCYKVVFTDNSKLMIDNKLDKEYYLLSLKDLINNYFILNSDYIIKRVKLNTKCIVKVDKQTDNTYYKVFVFDKSSLKQLQLILNYTNFKYKYNLNKKERQVVSKIKNNRLYGYKYSYNFNYMQDIRDNIKSIKIQLIDLKEQELNLITKLDNIKQELFNIEKLGFKTSNYKIKLNLSKSYKTCLNDYQQVKNKLVDIKEQILALEKQEQELITLEGDLTSSRDKETTIEDFLDSFKYIE